MRQGILCLCLCKVPYGGMCVWEGCLGVDMHAGICDSTVRKQFFVDMTLALPFPSPTPPLPSPLPFPSPSLPLSPPPSPLFPAAAPV